MSKVTIKEGFWFFFEDEGIEITANASTFSGKETVYVNDNPVSEKRSYGTLSLHNFQYNGKHYRVKFDVLNIWTQKVECTLSIDGTVQFTETKAYINGGVWGFLRQLGVWIGIGVTLGLVVGFLVSYFFA
ncbi:hypothetical protein [uncultured Paraglaciecola sp.]|uniref:hypothetical protein n=1 Tax=uncultured Paraglaciecola sp. TaxID=1765024 RepID=UPI0030D93A91